MTKSAAAARLRHEHESTRNAAEYGGRDVGSAWRSKLGPRVGWCEAGGRLGSRRRGACTGARAGARARAGTGSRTRTRTASTAGWNNDGAGNGLGAVRASAVDVDGRGRGQRAILPVRASRQRRSRASDRRRRDGGRGVRRGRVRSSRRVRGGGMTVFLSIAGVGLSSREGEKSDDGSREVHCVLYLL